MTNKYEEQDKELDKIVDSIPDKYQYFILLIEGADVTKDEYHTNTNIELEDTLIALSVLMERTKELIKQAEMNRDINFQV